MCLKAALPSQSTTFLFTTLTSLSLWNLLSYVQQRLPTPSKPLNKLWIRSPVLQTSETGRRQCDFYGKTSKQLLKGSVHSLRIFMLPRWENLNPSKELAAPPPDSNISKHSAGGERERSIFFRGYRYTLRDQDTTWPAAYESMRRGLGGGGLFTK